MSNKQLNILLVVAIVALLGVTIANVMIWQDTAEIFKQYLKTR